MKALKLSLVAVLAASSFTVLASETTSPNVAPVAPVATNVAPAPVKAPPAQGKLVVVDGQEFYCPRGFEPVDCPRIDGPRPQIGYHMGRGMGPNMDMPMGPAVGYALNADNFGPGPHHTAHLRPHRGPGMGKVMNTYCPHHNTLIGECLGDEFDKVLKEDFDKLQALKDQVFIKKQVLKARVNDGDSASSITKYAQDVNTAKKAVRDARYELDLKIRNLVQAHFDQGDKAEQK